MRNTVSDLHSASLAIDEDSAGAEDAPACKETDITIDGGTRAIPATVCMPSAEGKHPAVVMLHGTGSDRNEARNSFKHSAQILAEKYGIATIRIDFAGSGDSQASYQEYTFESAVADAVTAAQYMAHKKEIDAKKIGVMGLSQGGTDALLCAGMHPEIFKAIVTWSGAPDLSVMLTDELYEQAEKNGFFVMNFDWREPLEVSFQWCEDVKNTDVLNVFKAFEGPVLAIHGRNDTLVDPSWSEKIAETSNNEKSRAFFMDGADHIFNVFAEPEFNSLNQAVDVTGEFFCENL